ncbi:MAG: oxygen-independent coproporphyrinogen III oxidase-like protein [Rhodocyclaceae bacterium]|nr:oxygen-independent coproporphyrinogen III oxidase-like protein [Rhodocyclaceae bacterium]MBX3676114.1 oxygen-independent coproporphyrinogen III oxidase-like protein [Rhodocyclaceae bacterium]MCB1892952.1 oxygen-independent coproporphyrinogen III oxidase-like protein [Rhodocyclaceae bacterium]MCP5297901.1 oxygen-independent coproporphyrinogen III oxidase-like protein [Zoogloeaceae bacterium]PKO71784.1 MAG: oxygen-independent coproporphyrinogen III oxidase-like protein [Betaproteobacteria bact
MTQRVIPIVSAGRGAASAGLTTLPPLSLYVHFPWCVRKCPYCDFNSHEARNGIPEAAYLAALIADLEHALPLIWGRPVVSMFIGGGTPSLLAPESVDALLSAVRSRLTLLPDAEITLEANPGTAEADRFTGYRAAGVNRLSVGVQSFNPRHLAALGRIHDADEARRAVELALQCFDNVNLDMMYALPGQTLEEARADIEAAAAFGTPHLSAYHLTLEPNTAFHRAPPPLPDADLAAQMQDVAEETLAARGYEHYEVSAFARRGKQCRHNLNYWLFGDYLGIGAGAHGKLSSPERVLRQMRHKLPQAYLQAVARGDGVQEAHEVGVGDLPFEFMMNALRLTQGFPVRLFAERTGLTLGTIRPQLDEAVSKGLLDVTAERIAPTERGQRFLNDLLQLFLRD